MLDLYQSWKIVPGNLEIIEDNANYFMTHTIDMLDKRVNGILNTTDGAVFVNKEQFKDKHGNTVPWFGLSTGGMTVLNVLYNPDKCFNLAECGVNALLDLLNVTQGYAAVFHVFDYDGDMDCHVRLNGMDDIIYNKVRELMGCV